MSYFKEIVTKAVIGKGKKTTTDTKEVILNEKIDNVLGCWVINHSFSSNIINNGIVVSGNYDVNIWYSYNNNTKTNVIIKNFNYQEPMNIKLKDNGKINSNSEVIVKCLSQPSVTDVDVNDSVISLTIDKQMGIEVIGDALVKVSVDEEPTDYEEIMDDITDINENYLGD